MTTINNYRIFCNIEGTFVYTWSETQPTTCPHNTAHSIDTSSIAIVETKGSPTVTINDGIGGYYQASTIPITVPAGATGTVYTQDVTFPCDMWIWTTEFVANSSMIGDGFSCIVAPDSPIGVLTAPGATGDTVLNVSSTVFTSGYVVKGVDMSITDGISNSQRLGRVSAMDSVNGTITVETALATNYNAGSPVLLNIYVVRDQCIQVDGKTYAYGKKGFATRSVEQGRVMRFVYTNNTGTEKVLHFDMEYNYS